MRDLFFVIEIGDIFPLSYLLFNITFLSHRFFSPLNSFIFFRLLDCELQLDRFSAWGLHRARRRRERRDQRSARKRKQHWERGRGLGRDAACSQP